jgi:formylglycine-generating enzyme required for sulfatase activity
MNASHVGLLVVSMFVAMPVRPAASDSCREKDLDAEGQCPKLPSPRRSPEKAPELEIRGADIAGSEVSLDGKGAGRAPLVLSTTPGRHLVEVKRDNHASYSEWIEVKKGERRLVQVKLPPATTGTVPPPMTPTPPTTVTTTPQATTGTPPPPTPRATTGTAPPPPEVSCPEGMVRVHAGTFQMGSPEQGNWEAGYPEHAVTLSGYCLDKTEVTVKAYEACVTATGCSATEASALCNRADRPDHPINCVDWNQAAAYCKWAGKRLPSEAEWEYAARGTDGREYPWGNERPDAKRMNGSGNEDGWKATAPVGSFPAGASPFGALDMAGNVSEWTADWFGNYPAAAVTNPRGATIGTSRMLRGGSWYAGWPQHRTHQRGWAATSRRGYDIGFRCVRGD